MPLEIPDRRTEMLEQALNARKREVYDLRRVVDLAHRWDFGSIWPTRSDWGPRWETSSRRVVYFATRDYASGCYHYAAALNQVDRWAARLVVVHPHQYGYPTDIVYGAPTLISPELHQLLEEADVVHVKDEGGFFDGSNRVDSDLLTRPGKPRVFQLYGGVARRLQDDEDWRDHVRSHDAVFAVTPDLCFEWGDVRFIPHAVDATATPVTWVDSDLVGHSPSRRERKGTELFLEAARILGVEVDLIEGVPNAECVARKAKVGFFFDQAGYDVLASGRVVGWYGMSGLEALARGVPTMAHLSDEAFERAGHAIRSSLPVVDSGVTVESIKKALVGLLEMTPEERAVLSSTSRRWVESFHDYSVIGPRLVELYEEVI